MAQSDALKKYLDAGMAFTHLTRARAEQVVKDLVAAGELQRNQAKTAIDELLERSRKNAETLAEQVRKEVDEQLASLGLARKADVDKLEEELARLKGGGGGGGKAGDDKGADGDGDGGEAPSRPAKTAKKPAKATPAKPTKKAAPAGTGPVTTELPGRKEKDSGKADEAKPAPAKKAAKKGGGQDAQASDRSTPAKKTGKKQG